MFSPLLKVKFLLISSTDDMARTLKEGRFWVQITKMIEWKGTFADQGIETVLFYLVEGNPHDYVVKCTDGCMGISKCGYPTLSQVKVHVLFQSN